MYATGNIIKKPTIFSLRTLACFLRKQGKHVINQEGGGRDCCLFKCVKMGSSVSSQPHQQSQRATAIVEGQEEEEVSIQRDNKQMRVNGSPPQTPTPAHDHHEARLATLINEAKKSGWYIEPHEIEFEEMVAEGTTSSVYKGRWRGEEVAVKCIFPEYFGENEGAVLFFAQELETLSRQRHSSVIKLVGACLRPPEQGWLVTEFLRTTLKEWLHGKGKRGEERTTAAPPLSERLEKALEIAEAMRYLHEQRPMVIHRDLKPSNIFLDHHHRVRVADFGNARFLCPGDHAHSGQTGTYVYMAPEVIRSQPYNEKCDVYSFSIILNELVTGEHPYIETTYKPYQIACGVCGEEKLRPALPKEHGEKVKEIIALIRLSWDEDPSVRPSFTKITSTLRMIIHSNLTTSK